MLPNHAPRVIAEQFGTLVSLYGERIDLGLGRAPGTDPVTARALRRDLVGSADQFPQDVLELQSYFAAPADQVTRAVPGAGLKVPIWLLGSSLYSAQLAALLGLPFAFAAHFAPELLLQALAIYRSRFTPSAQLARAYAMICVNLIVADTERAAQRLFSSHQQAFTHLRRGRPGLLPPPIDDMSSFWSEAEKAMIAQSMRYSFVGSMASVRAGLAPFLEQTQPDELMVNVHVFDQIARRRSLALTAEIRAGLSGA
jgi:luciferase family oxidoreductase group 1